MSTYTENICNLFLTGIYWTLSALYWLEYSTDSSGFLDGIIYVKAEIWIFVVDQAKVICAGLLTR